MRVNHVQSAGHGHLSMVENYNPNFGKLKFKNKALKNLVQGINNSMEVSLESDNIPIAEKKIKNFMKMFMESWDFRLGKHPELPDELGYVPKLYKESHYPATSKRVLPEQVAQYNERLSKLGDRAADLDVEVAERTLGKDGDVTYLIDIPSMGVKQEKIVIDSMYTDPNYAWGVPTENEVKMLKGFIYENILGKDLVRETDYFSLSEAFGKIKSQNGKPTFDIYGNWEKLINYIQKN